MVNLCLSNEQVVHLRKIYGLFDLLGDIGGVFEIVSLFVAAIAMHASKNNFYERAIAELFAVDTGKPSILETEFEGGGVN